MRQSIFVCAVALLMCGITGNVFADQPKTTGYVQILGQAHINQRDNQFSVQRSEIVISSTDSLKTGYQLVVNFTSTTQLLNNAVVWAKLPRFHFVPASKLTIGKRKPPFGRQYLVVPTSLPVINYLNLTKTLIARDLGVIWETGTKRWSLYTAVFNGVEATGNLGQDNNNLKDVYGRLTVKPMSGLELGVSHRYGEAADTVKLKRVWGADCQYTFKKVQTTGEFVRSMQNDNVVGWNLMTVAKVRPTLETVLWYEDIDNQSLNAYQDFVGGGVNWYFQPNRKLAVNYVASIGQADCPDQILIQLQATF